MKPTRSLLSFLFGSVFLTAQLSHATSLYWDIDGATSGAGGATPSGTWSTGGTTWSTDSTGATATSAVTTTAFDDLIFSAATDATGAYAVGLNSSTQNARLVTFEDGTVTLSTGTLSLSNGGGITVAATAVTGATISSNLTISGSQTFNVAAGRTLTLDTGTFTRNAGATLNVLSTGTVTSTMTGLDSASMVNGIIGPWASFSSGASTTYATINGSNNIVGLGYTGGADGVTAAASTNVVTGAGNLNYTLGANGTLGASASINTLRYTAAGGILTTSTAFTTNGIMNVGGGTLTIAGTVTPGASGLVINAANGNITFNNAINNGGNLLVVDGAGTTTLTGTLTGAGGLTKNGTGRLFLTYGSGGNPTFGGPLTVNGGILQLGGGGSGSNISALPTGNITLNGGVLEPYWDDNFYRALGSGTSQIQITGGAAGFSGGRNVNIKFGNNNTPIVWGSTFFSPTALVLQAASGAGTVDFQNYVDLNGVNRTVEVNAASATLSGILSNTSGTAAGLTKTGAGILTLSGANTFNGQLTVQNGTLAIGTINNVSVNGTLGNSALSVILGSSGNTGSLRYTGANASSTKPFTLAASGTGGFDVSTAATILTLSGQIDGSGNLTKNGAGTLTLSGTNSYGGITTVNAGTLAIAKQLSLYNNTPASWTAANINVKSGATLALNVDSNASAGFDSSNLNTLLGNILVANTAAEGLQTGATLAIDTSTATGATFTQGNAIANSTGAFGGVIGLTKLGAGTLVLNQANTYSGPTTITTGTLQLGSGTATGSLNTAGTGINVASGATFAVNQSDTVTQGTEFSALIGGAGSVANDGAGTLVLNAPTYHTGNTSATVGNITLSHARAIQFSALNTTGAGSVTLSGTGATTPTFGGLSNSGTTRNLASVIDSSYSNVTNLTLNPQSGSTFTYSGVIANGATGMDLTKTGAGTQIFTGNNSYTGETHVNGGTLQLGTGGTIGKLSGTTGITFNGGTLQVTRSTNANIDAMSDAAPITSNGGTLSLSSNDAGGASANETIGAVDLVSGQFNLVWTNAGSSGVTTTLAPSGTGLTHSGSTSAVTFSSNTALAKFFVTGQATTAANEIIGAWATTGGQNGVAAQTDYASYNRTGGVINAVGMQGAGIAASAESTWSTTTAATSNYTLANANGSATNGRLTDNRNINTLRNTTVAGGTISLNTTTDVVTMGGSTFADGDVIVLGTANAPTAAGVPYYIRDAGTGGAGTFRLASTSGGTAINFTANSGGTLTAGVTLGTFNLGTLGILNGSTVPLVIGGSSGAVTLPTTTADNLHINAGSGAIVIDAPINNNTGTGVLTLVKNGSGTLTLRSTTSNYSGGTVLNAGTIAFSTDANFGATSGGLTFNGTSGLSYADLTVLNVNRSFTINQGALLTLSANLTVNGVFAGAGTLNPNSADGFYFTNPNNTFTGEIISQTAGNTGYGLEMASIGDTVGAGLINLVGGSGTFDWISASGRTTTLANRQFAISGAGAGIISASGTTAGSNLVINKDLLITGAAGARTLRLIGANLGNNTFAGGITDGPGSVVSLTKEEAGTWILSGANTYNGATTINAGTLVVTSLANGGPGNTSNIGSSSNAASNLILNGGTLRYTGAAVSTDRLFSLQVSSNIDASGTGAMNFTNTGAMGFNGGAAAKTLTLTGTNTGNNTIAAVIGDNTGATSITKTGIGTWVLSGGNTFTGATTISGGGKLVLDYSSQDDSKLSGTTALTLSNAAGDITLRGGSHLEAVGSLTIGTGGGHTSITRDGGSAKIALGAITRTAHGGVTMSLAEDNLATTTSANVNGILTGGITVGSNWAKNDGAGNIVGLSGISAGNYTDLSITAGGTSGAPLNNNYQLTGNKNATGEFVLGSLRLVNSADNDTLNMNTFGLRVSPLVPTLGNGAGGGILYVGDDGANTTNNTYTITGTGASYLQAQNGNQELIINTYRGTLNIDVPITTGSSALTKTGAGTLVLMKANTYAGATYVNQGTLQLRNATASGTTAGGIFVANNAALELANGITVGAEALTITGNGSGSNAGALRNVASNASTYQGAITIGTGGARINSDASGALTLSGGVTTSLFNNVTFGGAGNTTVQTVAISGAGGVTKDGAGITTLTATNTYTGATTVSDGTLLVNGSTVAASTVSVSAAGTLGGTGMIAGAVNVTGQLSPGASIETLGTGALALLNGSTLVHELDSSVGTSVGSDLLKVTGNLDLGATVGLSLDDLAATDVAFVDNDVFSLINYTGTWNNGMFTFSGNELSDEEVFAFGLNTWKISYDDAAGGLNYSGEFAGGADSFVNLTVVSTIPEPGAVFLGSMGLLLILRRRR